MLRITRSQHNKVARYRLEGKLAGPWVTELSDVLATEFFSDIELDLTEVGFVDAQGVALLRSLVQRGVQISQRSAFVAALLEANEHGC